MAQQLHLVMATIYGVKMANIIEIMALHYVLSLILCLLVNTVGGMKTIVYAVKTMKSF